MIHVIEKLKLNKFRVVHCITPKDLYSRLGHKIQPNTEFDSSDEVVPMNMNKLDSIEFLQSFDEHMQTAAQSKDTSNVGENGNFSDSQNSEN